METNKILSADILDIIFDGRNKEYGAYDLRKTYNNRLRTALFVMVGLVLALVAGNLISNYQGKGRLRPAGSSGCSAEGC
jgi:protein TonB